MSCGVGHRRDLDAMLLWLRRRLAAIALIQPLAWESPYAAGAVQEMAKRQKKIQNLFSLKKNPSESGHRGNLPQHNKGYI